jgi:membrane-associated phospholipid phosphatase
VPSNASRGWLLASAALAAVVVAALIGVTAGALGPHSVDGRIVAAAHRLVLRDHWVLDAARTSTNLGAPRTVDGVALAAAVGLSLWRQFRKAGFVLAVRLVTLVCDNALKSVVHRARPVLLDPVAHAHGYSFPSGHAAGAASAYLPLAVLLLGNRHAVIRRGAVGLAVAVCLLVGLSRVLLGVHFPTDVLAGLALGAALTCVGGWLVAGKRDPPIAEAGRTRSE